MNLVKCRYNLIKFPYILIFLITCTVLNYIRIQFAGQNLVHSLESPLLRKGYMSLQFNWKNDTPKFINTTSSVIFQSTKISANDNQDPKSFNNLTTQDRPVYILWSRWRRGSSFFGKLLSYAKSKTFYSYEPLHALGLRVFHETDLTTRYAMKFLHDVIHCQYQSHPYMINYLVETEFYFFHNPITKRKCVPVPTCNSTAILNNFCHESKLLVIKLLRLSLKYCNYLLNKYPQAKIIYLARDPRGTLKSRSRLMWCLLTKDCHDPSTVCTFLQEDLDYSKQLLQKYPQRFLFLRYEDLSLNTESVFRSIWEGLGQKFTARIHRLINKHTTTDLEKGIYGLKKDSRKKVFSWRSSLDFRTMTKIQNSCEDPMRELGYFRFNTEEEYENRSISSLESRWESVFNKYG